MMKKIALSEGELFDLFSSDCNTLADIAAIAGVTRERIRQIYNKRFRSRIGLRKTGQARRRVCARKRRAVARENAMPEGPALEAAIRANERGVIAGAILRKDDVVIAAKQRVLTLNGCLCVVSEPTTPRRMNPRSLTRYYRVPMTVMRQSFAFLIVLLHEHTFVIPRAVLVDASVGIYIPESGPSTYGHNEPRVNWWKYAERWDLLGGVQ